MGNIFIGLLLGLLIGAVTLYLCLPKVAMKKINVLLAGLMSSDETIRDFLSHNLSEAEAERFINKLKKELSEQIYHRISDGSICDGVANKLVEHVNTKLSSIQIERKPSQGFIDRKKDELKNKIKNHAENIIENNQELIEEVLSNKINDVITRDGEDLVTNIVNQEVDNILSRPVSSLFQGNEETISELKQLISSVLLSKRQFTH